MSTAIGDSVYKISSHSALPDIWVIDTGFFNLIRNKIVPEYMCNISFIPFEYIK